MKRLHHPARLASRDRCALALLTTMTLSLAALLPAAHAATIYRCGQTGNVYSDQPCADGRAVVASDSRTEDQRLEGLRVAALERRHAGDLQRERLRREAVPAPQAVGIGLHPVPAAFALAERRGSLPKPKRQAARAAAASRETGTDFVALAPGRPRRP